MADEVVTFRHPEYQETAHQALLERTTLRLYGAPDGGNPFDRNPYAEWENPYNDAIFFSEGYVLANYPALYDMFGHHMAGMDIEAIWNEAWKDIMTPEEILAFVRKWIVLINEKFANEIVPKFLAKMRDLNAVNSSTHIVGLADIEKQRVFECERASLEAQAALAEQLNESQDERMNWHIKTIHRYSLCILDWVTCNMQTQDFENRQNTLQEVWNLTLEENMRKALAVFVPRSPVTRAQMAAASESTAVKVVSVIGWTITGATIGSYYPPYGTVIGGVIGFIVGLADWFLF